MLKIRLKDGSVRDVVDSDVIPIGCQQCENYKFYANGIMINCEKKSWDGNTLCSKPKLFPTWKKYIRQKKLIRILEEKITE